MNGNGIMWLEYLFTQHLRHSRIRRLSIDLSGLIDLDMNNPSKAFVPFNMELESREKSRMLG
jgi:hypothetical protein